GRLRGDHAPERCERRAARGARLQAGRGVPADRLEVRRLARCRLVAAGAAAGRRLSAAVRTGSAGAAQLALRVRSSVAPRVVTGGCWARTQEAAGRLWRGPEVGEAGCRAGRARGSSAARADE